MARDARRAARDTSCELDPRLRTLADAQSDDSDTDNEQDDKIYSPCVVSQHLPATPTLCPCLRTVCATKDHSVSFQDVFIGEFCTLCPTLRHVHSRHRATNLEFIFDNDGTKTSPSSVLDYFIEDNSCHYEQWSSDMITNRTFHTDFRKKNPAFKKENPGLR